MSDARTRRQPPRFRSAAVVRTEERSAHLVRVTLGGGELAGLERGLPASSVRLLLPDADGTLPAIEWTGNEFLRPDGARPLLRTLTPLRVDAAANELDVEVVCHGASPLTTWARSAVAGSAVAVSGTGRGYEIDRSAGAFVLAGDESAMPAISTLLAELDGTADRGEVAVVIEVRDDDAPVDLGAPEGVEVTWCAARPGGRPGDAMVEALEAMTLGDDVRVWAAGEAAAVQRIRKLLFEERGLDRSQASVRGYWKVGRAEGGGSGAS